MSARNAVGDISGLRSGRLVALSACGKGASREVRWLCACDCGKQHIANASALARNRIKSCGCLKHDTKPSFRHGMTYTRAFRIWTGMHYRCNDVTDARYGGRGIRVCERWSVFENFFADMGIPPKGMTLDRYPDNDGNYEPGNCRWATAPEQCRNKGNNALYTFNGETLCLAAWAERIGITAATLARRLNKLQWPLERALTAARAPRLTKEQIAEIASSSEATTVLARRYGIHYSHIWRIQNKEAIAMRATNRRPESVLYVPGAEKYPTARVEGETA